MTTPAANDVFAAMIARFAHFGARPFGDVAMQILNASARVARGKRTNGRCSFISIIAVERRPANAQFIGKIRTTLVAQIRMLGRDWIHPPRKCASVRAASRVFPFSFRGQSFVRELAIRFGLIPRHAIDRMVVAICLTTIAEFAPFLLRRG